ncbi:MAG: hypothetical protein E6149_09440 [Peptoniphilus harei]|nr:hypothetical protein [Peptoniphilus harei]
MSVNQWILLLVGSFLAGVLIMLAIEGMWSYIVLPILIVLVLVRLSIPSKKQELRDEQLKYYKNKNRENQINNKEE